MRILHVTPYYRPAYAFGGVVRAVEGMAEALAARGHAVTILTTDALDHRRRYGGAQDEPGEFLRVLRRPNVLPWLRGRWNLSTPRGMRQLAETIMPCVDIVHLHEFRTLENLLVAPVARRHGKPIALSPHGTLNLTTGRSRFKSAWDRLLSPGIARRIDHVFALTETELAEAQTLWRGFGARQRPMGFSTVANGVDIGELTGLPSAVGLRQRLGMGDAETVLFMGRLQARKGLDILIKAFKSADVDNSRLLIVGPDEGMLPQLRALAGDDSRIIFAGYLAGSARLEALAAGDVFALPATGEGQSIALLEAMAAGLPAVISPGCNMKEVETAGAGHVVEADVEAFADKLRELLRDDEKRREMGVRARRMVVERYTWGAAAQALERVYERMSNAAIQ